MSFLNIRGEMFHCKQCEKVITSEFAGAPTLTQIGDFNVYQQIEFNKKFMPADYEPNKNGYYFHELVICESCMQSRIIKDVLIYKNSKSLPFYHIKNILEESRKMVIQVMETEKISFSEKFNRDFCYAFDRSTFESTIGQKKFKLTNRKRELAEKFTEGSRRSIVEAYTNHIMETHAFKDISRQYERSVNILEKECKKILESNQQEYFNKINYNLKVNLNSHICHPYTGRERRQPLETIELYYGPYKIPIEEMKNYFSMDIKDKLIHEDRYEFRSLFRDLNNLIVEKIEQSC